MVGDNLSSNSAISVLNCAKSEKILGFIKYSNPKPAEKFKECKTKPNPNKSKILKNLRLRLENEQLSIYPNSLNFDFALSTCIIKYCWGFWLQETRRKLFQTRVLTHIHVWFQFQVNMLNKITVLFPILSLFVSYPLLYSNKRPPSKKLPPPRNAPQ